jgi:hypothetical protein
LLTAIMRWSATMLQKYNPSRQVAFKDLPSGIVFKFQNGTRDKWFKKVGDGYVLYSNLDATPTPLHGDVLVWTY